MNFQATLHFKTFILSILCLLMQGIAWSQCSTGDIGGVVFRDVPAADANTANIYGVKESNEKGMANIIVTVVDAHGAVLTDTTDANGNWSVSPELFPVRVEYFWEDGWLDISPGNNTNTDIQVFGTPVCDTRLGLQYPDEYCQMVPSVTTSCFVSGDPLAAGTTGAIDAIVSFPYNNTGDATAPVHDAFMSEVGAVWGAAYNNYTQQAFFSAVMKRHVGLGPAGIGGIYRIDYSGASPTASTFIDLVTLGVNLGVEPTRVLNADWGTPASDSLMFDAPGKLGIGDIEMSDDGNTLYAVNLFEKNIVTIDLTAYNSSGTLPTAGDVATLPAMPTLGCTNGTTRPFALKYRRGNVYAGVVCSAENGGTSTDLSAAVCVYNESTGLWSDAVNPFSLDYVKGGAVDNTCTTWQPWIGTYDDVFINCRPTPMLTDIEIVGDSTILLAFADRYAFQKFTFQRDSTNANEENVVSGGDILMGYFNGTNYSMESNGSTPFGGGCGANGQGIGGGEYFCGDFIGTEHSEISLGAMTVLPGSGEVLLSVINPVNYNSGGVRRFDLATGTSGISEGYQLYQTVTFPGGNGNAAKGGGVGDLEVLCEAAPIELLSYLWSDNNQDGIQDPYETGLENVEISLFDLAGNLLGTTTTDANGLYTFSDTLAPNTTYYVAIGTDGGFNTGTGMLNDSLNLTSLNTGMGTNADKNDSDIAIASGVNPAVDDYPYYSFTTGNSGQLIHNNDAGFFPPCTMPVLVPIDTTICVGETVDLKELIYDSEPLTTFTGICYYFATLNDAELEQAFLGVLQSPSSTTTYYVRKNTNDLSCFDIDSILITVNPLPVLIASDFTMCNGDTTSLDAWSVEITGQGSTLDYYLTLADANAETNVLASPIVFPSTTTEYYVRANSTAAENCADIDSLTITINNCGFDLAMKMVLAPGESATSNPGDTVSHVVWIYNQGSVPAYDIDLFVYLSPGVVFDNNINTNSIWTDSTNILRTTIVGPIAAGDSLAVALDLLIDPFYTGGTVTNFIEITGYDDDTNNANTGPDDLDSVTDSNVFNDQVVDNDVNNSPDNPNDDDDHDSETLFINQVFDLALLVDGPASTVSPCDTVTFGLTVYNQGNVSAYDVVLTDYLPTGMTFDGTLPNNGDWAIVAGLPTDTLPGPIGPGDFVLVYLDLVVDCGYSSTTLDNFFEITGYDNDTDDFNMPPSDNDSVTDLDGNNDLTIDNEINNNPDNPNDDDDHDGFTLAVYQGVPPTMDTLYYTTVENTTLTNLCMSVLELSGSVQSVNDCGLPNDGTLVINSPDVCVDYIPNNGFTGQDTACVIVCDVNALCDTTLLVFTVTPLPTTTTDTLYFSTVQDVALNNLCADVSELIAAINTVTSCGDPANGNMIISPGDECINYNPSSGFTGTDTSCVVVCDMNGLCDTTIFVYTINPLPIVDTITTILIVNTNVPNICLDITSLSGPVSTAASCGDPDNGTLTINSPSECVGYTPNSGYIGTDTACVVLCDVNAICDTTILIFNITPDCSTIISETDLLIELDACGDTATVCLDVAIGNIGNYNIYDNGAAYVGSIAACDFDTSFFFNYSSLPGMGLAGPYTVNSWTVNGVTYNGTVNDMQALTDSLNVWNPGGNWTLDAPNASIIGGLNSDVFSSIDMVTNNLMAQMTLNPNGTQLELLSGTHEIVLEDIFLNCFDTLNVVVTCCTQLFTAPVALSANDCNSTVDFCTEIPSTDIANYTITDNGTTYAGPFGACLMNASMPLDTGYHEVIFNNTVNGCLDTAFVTVSCNDCPSFVDDATMMVNDCSDLTSYCVGISPNNTSDYEVSDNGVQFTGAMIGCDFDSLITYITIGFSISGNYTLEEWVVSGVNYSGITFSTAGQLVDSMNVWLPAGNWAVQGLFIVGQGDINNFGPLVVSSNGVEVASPDAVPQLQPNGVSVMLDTGLHVITVLEISTGCVDTAMVTVSCIPPADDCDFIGDAVQNINLANCDDITTLCLDINSTTPADYEIFQNGALYTGATQFCGVDSIPTYLYSSLVGQGIFGSYTLDIWNVDGQVFSGGFENVNDLVDSMNVWDPAGNWTLDAANETIRGVDNGQSYGPLVITHVPTTTAASLPVVLEEAFTNLSITLPAGNHQIIVNDLVNNCSDTADILISCLTTEYWTEFTEVGETDTICFDVSELPGTAVSITNFCEDASGEFAVVETIAGAYCLAISGMEIGLDTACILICDDLGFCDTTYVYISVVEDADLPDANQDSIYTTINTSIVYDLTANDNMQGAPDSIYIITLPEHGGLIVNENGIIEYVPDQDYCDPLNPDKMTYAICNDIGCDTTEVFFFIPCELQELDFVSGFSPNGDGVNDGFYIQGLNNYPNHQLSIFNRWGNRVYFSDDYRNDWFGTFNKDGVELPDGTYFYLFDTGEGELRSGYLQIHR